MENIINDELVFLETLEENKEVMSACIYYLLKKAQIDVFAEFDNKENLVNIEFRNTL